MTAGPTKALVARATESGTRLGQVEGRQRPPLGRFNGRITCPHCGRPATAEERLFVRSPDGPVERLRFGCPVGHWLIPQNGRGESRWTE